MAHSKQAEIDGTLVTDEDPPHPNLKEQEDNLKIALSSNGYTLNTLRQTQYPPSRFVKFTAEIEKGPHKLNIEIFYFPNLAWSSGNRSDLEKRIQITQNWADHSSEFSLPKTGSHLCVLIGTYTRNKQTIFCAWDVASYHDHKNPTSCYVDVDAIGKAMRDGFGQSVDKKNRLVCCFRPEFIHYYLNNMEELHERVMVSGLNLGPLAPQLLKISALPNPLPSDIPRNRVLYGAPGTGKSFKLI